MTCAGGLPESNRRHSKESNPRRAELGLRRMDVVLDIAFLSKRGDQVEIVFGRGRVISAGGRVMNRGGIRSMALFATRLSS